MYLFFDTETTGIPRSHDAPASDVANWPRLVQIAWAVTDEGGNELRSQAFIIRPDGFEIPASATRVHGITTDTAHRLGIDIGRALTAFAKDLSAAEVLVAHNVQFDERVVGAEFFRLGRKKNPLQSKTLYCTMRSSTDFCRLPGGPRGYKWPTLEQLHRALFGVAFESAHNAIADVRACAKCFFELKRRRIISGSESPDDDDEVSLDDQDLFDEIYSFADLCPWFDTGRFVDNVYAQFEERGFITDAQRDALVRIRDMLEEKAG
ncbi:MAG: 3'-5' exonuclease [Defluviicoccus sp.]|nr:3'-5' exonuclease [Defluviicoccus sp.]